MKNILIWGPARAGKTTLAKKLHDEYGHSVVCTDCIVAAFESVFPQLAITPAGRDTAENFAPFIAHYLCALAHESYMRNGNKFVAALTHFAVETVFSQMEKIFRETGDLKLRDEFDLIGLAYNHKSWEDLRRDIKQHDTEEDWTHRLTRDELDDFCKGSVEHNKFFAEKFIEYNFRVYDVSAERNTVLEKIVEDIKGDTK